MKKKPLTTDAAIKLRHQAEAKLDEQNQPAPPGVMAETQNLIHELQVHQIELEMQNEELRRTQTELEASQSRYFDIYDLAPVGYLILSEKSQIVEANLTAANLLGMARSSLTNYSLPLFILIADRIIYHQHWKNLIKTRSPQTCELRMKRKDGFQFWARLEMGIGQDTEGASALRIVLADISDRKQAEAAIASLALRNETFLQTARDGILVLDDQGNVFEANPAFCNMLGYSLEELLTLNVADWDAQWSGEELLEKLNELIAHPAIFETRHRHKDGTLRDVEINSVGVLLEGRKYLYATARDITDRKLAAEAMRASEQRYREMFENNTAIKLLVDPLSGAIIQANQAAARFYGWAVNVLETMNISQINTLPLEQIKIEMAQAAIQKRSYFNFRHVRASGDVRDVEVHSSPLEVGGRNLLFSIIHDVTDRKQAEQALHEAHTLLEQRVAARTADLQAANLKLAKAMHLKDEFLAIMSHELRTPLTGILGLSEILRMRTAGPLNEKQNTYLDHIYNSSQHLLELLNNILDLSKLVNGELELSTAPCSLAKICHSSLQELAAAARAKNLQASFSTTPDQIIIQADGRRLKQIILHLLNNAIKFTPPGGSFGIQALGNQSAGQVQITIWDTGIGIKAEDQVRLFQPFVQLDTRLARQYNGSGLGLALVQRLVELHDGNVSVESTIGKGSRFTVTLPWLGQHPKPVESQENELKF